MSRAKLQLPDIERAYERIHSHIVQTPILTSQHLNDLCGGHQIFFKAEPFQKIGAFKARGALNAILAQLENGESPTKVVADSSGNHAQGVAWAASKTGISAEIFMPRRASRVKYEAARGYGAKVTLLETRRECTAAAVAASEKPGVMLIPPYDHDEVICGQGTAFFEAVKFQGADVDAVFAPCGGGGLLSGTYIAANGLNPKIKVFGGEPLLANDAAQSLKAGRIVALAGDPQTIADGVRTLSVSSRTFNYLQCLSGILEITEEEIFQWTKRLTHYLKVHCEPTASLGMAGAAKWLQDQSEPQRVMVILSGGNVDAATLRALWASDVA